MEDAKEREQNYVIFVKALLDCFHFVGEGVRYREGVQVVGRWEDSKSRPLLLSFTNLELKDWMMVNLKNLADGTVGTKIFDHTGRKPGYGLRP